MFLLSREIRHGKRIFEPLFYGLTATALSESDRHALD
jgi:hypothetical protein